MARRFLPEEIDRAGEARRRADWHRDLVGRFDY
jgi:hypothetical protein